MRSFALIAAFSGLFAVDAAAQRADTSLRLELKPVRDSVRPGFRFAERQVLPRDFATSGFGFFCRQELRLEQKTGIPLRVRLGSTAECDRLEQKHSNAVPLP